MGLDGAKAGSYVAGLLFGIGWWIFVDGAATAAHRDSQIPFNFVKYVPGIVSSLGFFLLNTLDWEMLSSDSMYRSSSDVAGRARTFVLFCLALTIGGLVGSIVVLTHTYVDNIYDETAWPGVAVLLQNVLIFLATGVMRVGLISSMN